MQWKFLQINFERIYLETGHPREAQVNQKQFYYILYIFKEERVTQRWKSSPSTIGGPRSDRLQWNWSRRSGISSSSLLLLVSLLNLRVFTRRCSYFSLFSFKNKQFPDLNLKPNLKAVGSALLQDYCVVYFRKFEKSSYVTQSQQTQRTYNARNFIIRLSSVFRVENEPPP